MSNRTPAELSKLGIAELRKIAAGYRLPLRRDMDVASISALIASYESGPAEKIAAVEDNTRPKPGWARIQIHKNPDPSASNSDVFVGVNNYQVQIKRGVTVDVPIKILTGSLKNAEMTVLRTNEAEVDLEKRFYWETVPSYPYTVLDINPGPDPRDNYERTITKKQKFKRMFKEENGYWPKTSELRDFISAQTKKSK